ncbi:MAG: hypothetical protein ACXWVD_00235 [Telluria sp.]
MKAPAAHNGEGEVIDLSGEVADLTIEITELCGESELPPVATVCACLAVVFEHARNMAGLQNLRDLIAQHEALWLQQHAASDPLIHPPHQGALQ